MAVGANFLLTGKVRYVKDFPPTPGKPFGQVRFQLLVESQYIDTMLIPAHGVFISVRYNPDDVTKAGFQQFKSRLVTEANVLVRGAVKPRPQTDKYPATLNLDANYRDVLFSHKPYPVKNFFEFSGEVIKKEQNHIYVKYNYRNPKEKDPKLCWKEREYVLSLVSDCDKQSRDLVYIQGRIFNVTPTTSGNREVMWIVADEIY